MLRRACSAAVVVWRHVSRNGSPIEQAPPFPATLRVCCGFGHARVRRFCVTSESSAVLPLIKDDKEGQGRVESEVSFSGVEVDLSEHVERTGLPKANSTHGKSQDGKNVPVAKVLSKKERRKQARKKGTPKSSVAAKKTSAAGVEPREEGMVVSTGPKTSKQSSKRLKMRAGSEAAQEKKRQTKKITRKQRDGSILCDASWAGLSAERKRRIPANSRCNGLAKLQNEALDAAFCSLLRHSSEPMKQAMRLFESSKAQNVGFAFKPSGSAVLSLMECALWEAEKDGSVWELSANGADVACEVLFRTMEVFKIRPGLEALSAILRHARRDPVVRRRSERALSVLRLLLSTQLQPTAGFIYDCFETCVSGLDVEAAAVLMDVALSQGLHSPPSGAGPREVDYYNGVIQAGLLRGELGAAAAAHDALVRRGVRADRRTDSLHAALCLERGDERAAGILVGALRRGGALDDVVVACLLRAAGRRRDAVAALRLYEEYEAGGGGRAAAASGPPRARGAWAGIASDVARAEPTAALFHALRTCGAAEEAVAKLRHLQAAYGFRAGQGVLAVVVETCWKGGRLDLARALREEMVGGDRRRADGAGGEGGTPPAK